MKPSQFFHLDGHGYLENISYRESKCIANIKAINSSHKDDISLECEIKGVFEEYLLALLNKVKEGNSVILSFKAQYSRCETIHHCFGPNGEECDDQIVVFGCKLKGLGNCYINGSLVDKHYFRHLGAA